MLRVSEVPVELEVCQVYLAAQVDREEQDHRVPQGSPERQAKQADRVENIQRMTLEKYVLPCSEIDCQN